MQLSDLLLLPLPLQLAWTLALPRHSLILQFDELQLFARINSNFFVILLS